MKNLIKQIERLDSEAASSIIRVLEGAVVDDATLILLKSDDPVKRLKGLTSILTSISTDVLGQLSSKDDKDIADLLDKRFKRMSLHLDQVLRIVRRLKSDNKFKNTNEKEQVPTYVPTNPQEGGPHS